MKYLQCVSNVKISIPTKAIYRYITVLITIQHWLCKNYFKKFEINVKPWSSLNWQGYLEQLNKVEETKLPDFILSYRILYNKAGHIKNRNKMHSRNENLCVYIRWFSARISRIRNCKGIVFSISCQENWISQCRKNDTRSLSHDIFQSQCKIKTWKTSTWM